MMDSTLTMTAEEWQGITKLLRDEIDRSLRKGDFTTAKNINILAKKWKEQAKPQLEAHKARLPRTRRIK